MSFSVVIPARFAATRLPGKPLLDIGGKPMIQHTWERALASSAEAVYIATDDERIREAAEGFGAKVCMTATTHRSGTDRIQEVATQLALPPEHIIVNVQADEPLIPHEVIEQVAANLATHPDVGISINTDGNLYMSPANFLRLFPERSPGSVDIGLIRLEPGADRESIRREIEPLLNSEARVLTREELVDAEIRFIRENAPIDFIFGMGAAVGFFVGFVVVYQILYTEVTNHLPQYATLKAMGFSDGYLLRVVFWQAMILSILGYFPGFALAIWLYDVATEAIQMQFHMTTERACLVFCMTIVMCCLSASMAISRIRSADPADVF